MNNQGCGVSAAKMALIGLLAIIGGIGYIVIGPQLGMGVRGRPFSGRFTVADLQRIRQMTPITAAGLQSAAPGSEVLVEGTLEGNEVLQQMMVAYVHRSRMTIAGNEIIDHTYTAPPLTVQVADGTVRLSEGYELVKTTRAWVPNNRSGNSYSGVGNGDKVVVLGTVVEEGGARYVDAELVSAGSRTDLLFDRAGQLAQYFIGGCCAVSIGAIMLILAIGIRKAGRAQP